MLSLSTDNLTKRHQSTLALTLVLIFFYAIPIVFIYREYYYQLYYCLYLIVSVHLFNKVKFNSQLRTRKIRIKWFWAAFFVIIFSANFHVWRLTLPIFILLIGPNSIKPQIKRVASYLLIAFMWLTGYSKFYLYTSLFFYWNKFKFLLLFLLLFLFVFYSDIIVSKSMGVAGGKLLGLDAPYVSDYILDLDREKMPFLHSFSAFFLNPIPRQFWQNKPMAESILVSSYIHKLPVERIFTNYGPGFIGLSWWNFGYLGFFLTPLLFSYLAKFIIGLELNNVFFILIFAWALLVRGDWLNAFVNLTLVLGFLKFVKLY